MLLSIHYSYQQIQGEEGVTALSTDGPLRMITQGQELTIDYDERTLYDMGFKDNQVSATFCNIYTNINQIRFSV